MQSQPLVLPRAFLPLELWELIIEQCSLLELEPPPSQLPAALHLRSSDDDASTPEPSTRAQTIYDLIIYRRKVLLTCALTCTSWLPTSLRHLYRSLLVSDYGLLSQKFIDLLMYKRRRDDNPSEDLVISTRDALGVLYIKPFDGLVPLKIRFLSDQRAITFQRSSYLRHTRPLGFDIDDNDGNPLASLFPELDATALLPLDSSVSIEENPSSIGIIDRTWRTQLCVRAVQELHLHLLIFRSFPSLIQTLQSLPSLRRLFMKDISFQENYTPSPEYYHFERAPRVKLLVVHCHLHIDVMHLILKWMLYHDVFSETLVDLKIDDYGAWLLDEETRKDHREIASMIPTITKSAGTRLKRVDIRCEFEDKDSLRSLDLRANEHLEVLIIHNITASTATTILATTRSSHLTLVEIHYLTIRTLNELDALVDILIEPRFSLSLLKLSLYTFAPSEFDTALGQLDWNRRAEVQSEMLSVRQRSLKDVYGERLTWRVTF